MKQVEVTILGQSYRLSCPDDGEVQLHTAVARVDREMSAIRDAGKVKARERMAVLAALNLAYQLAGGDAPGRTEPPQPPRPQPGDELIAGLVQRIDQALAADGQLL